MQKLNYLEANCWVRQSEVKWKERIKLDVGGNKTISNVTDWIPADALWLSYTVGQVKGFINVPSVLQNPR